MKVKKTVLTVCLVVFLILPTANAFAFGPGRTLTLGVLGTALGYAIGGDGRDAAIGAAAGLVTGMLVDCAHHSHCYHDAYYRGRHARWHRAPVVYHCRRVACTTCRPVVVDCHRVVHSRYYVAGHSRPY